ncbi:MAG TPA: SDR family oxidoreductase [Vicinamibacterales bacterium]|nr:SDR family oxidoreductase [Vicinamibacterales bacterium]
MNMTALTGKVAVITGGSRGIGLATARALREQGAHVAVIGTKDVTVANAREELQRSAGSASVVGVRADVRTYAEVEHALDEIASTLGGIDILVNNAGVGVFKSVADMSVDEWHTVLDTNLSGVFYCCHAALPHLRRRGGGWIINISSLASKNPFVNAAAYSASKAALNAFSEALMQEVRYEGIRVSYVLPGSVNTGFGRLPNTKSEGALQPEDVAAAVVDLVNHPARSLPSRVEIRPSQPPRKG